MFTALAPYAGFGMKLVFGNLWLFGPLLKAVMPSLSAQAGAIKDHDSVYGTEGIRCL